MAAGFELITDELGEATRVLVDLQLYERAAVFKTAYWATERAYVYLLPMSEPNILTVEIRTKSVSTGSSEALARDFCNALIDQQTRQVVLRETSEIRDALLRKAFSEGHRHSDPSALG